MITHAAEYKTIKELGKGGFGRVLLVLRKSDNQYYAMKEIKLEGMTQNSINEIKAEAHFLSKFNCENIVKYYDSFQNGDKFYILMEFCAGQNLRKFIEEYQRKKSLIPENVLYNIIRQICVGIREIHRMKIAHRDLKPENIFINANMNIKIGDFGISRQLDPNKTHISTLHVAGTQLYMAPEIYEGKYNEKSDMYALGCIIYEFIFLHFYYVDKQMNKIKKIYTNIYNYKWQTLIDSLLEIDYKKRINIDQAFYLLDDINKGNNNLGILESKINNLNINEENKNMIIGEIYIRKEDVNKNIRIINSYDNYCREGKLSIKEKFSNEKEIIKNIEIKINGKKIKFAYYYKFNKEGKYIIEYSFKKDLTKTCYMFRDCNKLTYLNLSNFNTQNVTNMSYMFDGCNSLTNLNLLNFNTQNVTDMYEIFTNCNSLPYSSEYRP